MYVVRWGNKGYLINAEAEGVIIGSKSWND